MGATPGVPTSTPLSAWISELGQPTGSPGGGAAAGIMIGLSAALTRMVAEYTRDDVRSSESAARLVDIRVRALKTAEADGACSAAFGKALALSIDDPQRDQRVRDAAIAAARSSVALGEVGREVLQELRTVAEISATPLKADVAVAAEALSAGLAGAQVNLRANLQTAQKHGATDRMLGPLQTRAHGLGEDRSAAAATAEASAQHFAE